MDDHNGSGGRVLSSLLSPIKTEPAGEGPPQLYRFTPSPPPAMRYSNFSADVRGATSSSYDQDHRSAYTNTHQSHNSNIQYHTSPSSSPSGNYVAHHQQTSNGYSDGANHYPVSGSDDGHYNEHYSPEGSSSPTFCPCRTNPATAVAYLSLSEHLQTSLTSLRQFAHHPPHTQCSVYRRMLELYSLIRCALLLFWLYSPAFFFFALR